MKVDEAKEVLEGMDGLGRELAAALGLEAEDRYAILRAIAPVTELELREAAGEGVDRARLWRVGRVTAMSLPGLASGVRELFAFFERAGATVRELADSQLNLAPADVFRGSGGEAESLAVRRTAAFAAWAVESAAYDESAFLAEGRSRGLTDDEVAGVRKALED